MEQLVKDIYHDLEDRFDLSMNKTSLTGLLMGSEIDKIYSGYTPMEFLTVYKINLMYSTGEIDNQTFINISEIYKRLLKRKAQIYNCYEDVKHSLRHGNFTDSDIQLYSNERLERLEEEKEHCEEYLKQYGLPMEFNLSNLINNFSGVTTDKTYTGDNQALIDTYKYVKRMFNHLLYESTITHPINCVANPTKVKAYGKYNRYTLNEFLNVYMIQLKCDKKLINVDEEKDLLQIYDEFLKVSDCIKYCNDSNALPSLVANQREYEYELKRYGLPLEFDLDGIVNSYGKKENKEIEKVK